MSIDMAPDGVEVVMGSALEEWVRSLSDEELRNIIHERGLMFFMRRGYDV